MGKVTKKDLEILQHLRKNAREKVTEISKNVGMPATTIYSKMLAHQKNGVVKKHTALLDFSKIGFNTNALVALKISKKRRDEIQNYLTGHNNINSLYSVVSNQTNIDEPHRISIDKWLLAEIVFQNMSQLQEFMDDMQVKFDVRDFQIFHIINEIKKEDFLCNALPENGNGMKKMQEVVKNGQ